ncbi:MAG: hypothetical protein RIQ99_1319 [Pseudomonadota bacterium]|jgi:2-haloacid dehalogenase
MPSSIPPPVAAVVFDVGRVLVEWDLALIYRDLIADPVARRRFVETVVTPEWHYQHDAGRPLAEMVAERIAEFPQHANLIRRYASHFNDSIPGPIPGSIELVEALAAAGVPLYAITNFGAELWAGFRPHWPVFRHFHDIVVSGVERLAKPDPAIYALAQHRFGHAPHAMLFIDDNAANIAAARACGWQVHHFQDAAALRTDLLTRGLIA